MLVFIRVIMPAVETMNFSLSTSITQPDSISCNGGRIQIDYVVAQQFHTEETEILLLDVYWKWG